MTAECTAKQFRDIRNPYTGKRMVVMLKTTVKGEVKFFCPDTYSTSDRQPTAELAYRRWNRVNGVEGGKEGRPVVCAYTGKPLVLRHDEDGYWYEGGFNPRLMYSRADFLRFATARGSIAPCAQPPSRVVHAPTPERTRRRGHAPELTDEAVAAAEKVVEGMKGVAEVGTGAPVSMHVPSSGKRRAARHG